MIEIPISFLALFTGILLGMVFSVLGLPIPAPPEKAGIMGIIGIYLGFQIVQNYALIISKLNVM